MAAAKCRAKKGGFAYDLDEHMQEMEQRFNAGICELSGIPLDYDRSDGRLFNTPSLDRIDSSKGYTYDNVRIICWLANTALSDWGEETLRIVMESWLGKKQ